MYSQIHWTQGVKRQWLETHGSSNLLPSLKIMCGVLTYHVTSKNTFFFSSTVVLILLYCGHKCIAEKRITVDATLHIHTYFQIISLIMKYNKGKFKKVADFMQCRNVFLRFRWWITQIYFSLRLATYIWSVQWCISYLTEYTESNLWICNMISIVTGFAAMYFSPQ
jgi:hypothetical protein